MLVRAFCFKRAPVKKNNLNQNQEGGQAMKIHKQILLTVLATSILVASGAYAATLEVGPGKTYTAIQPAINDATTGDTVLVYDGKYVENINFLGQAITLKSLSGASKTIIYGTHDGTVVTFNNGEGAGSVLDGFTITNGGKMLTTPPLFGGGIYCFNSSPTIINCTIRNNSINGQGGGIYCFNSTSTFTGCTISENEVHAGGYTNDNQGGVFTSHPRQ